MFFTNTIIITGASRGIGRAIAIKFAKEGYNLSLNCIHNKDMLLELKEYVESKFSIKCHTFVGDISSYDNAQTFINETFEIFGSADVLVNNAGIAHVGLFQDTTPAQWNKIINTNLTSIYNCCHMTVPEFISKKAGKIINISSVWGICGASCEVAYSATKGAVNSFTRALAKELAPSNIQVNAIACGAIDTDMNKCFTKEELLELANEIPSLRLGTANEVAELAFDLATKHPYLTGQVIGLDGGWI